jgi:Fe-S-cluster-containing hydrogenase component 2
MLAPLQSLKQGNWFKLICGASFQHLPAVRNLTLAYTLAGADCIDVAADPAVIAAAKEALEVALNLAPEAARRGFGKRETSPFLMVSLNDGEDPHFRKAEFNATQCPIECKQPCQSICPAQAIVFSSLKNNYSGVIEDKCYGCGRCLSACPYDIIYTRDYVSTPGSIESIISTGVDAVEIHTRVGSATEFERLWRNISPWIKQLKLVAVSCPDGEGMIDYLRGLYDQISPVHKNALIWQTDGRPMSGDIGDGATGPAIKLGTKVLAAKLPGYVQLAGGTNNYTVKKLRALGLLNDFGLSISDLGLDSYGLESEISSFQSKISGVAYGSYARVLLSPILDKLEKREVNNTDIQTTILRLEDKPELLWQAVGLAFKLVSQLKSPGHALMPKA